MMLHPALIASPQRRFNTALRQAIATVVVDKQRELIVYMQ